MSMQGASDPNSSEVAPTTELHRGDSAIGADGPLGTVEQIVVDQETGEQRSIVIRRTTDNAEFEVPVDQVERLVPGALHLKLSRADFDNRPDLARPYDPDQYVPVFPGDEASRPEAERIVQDTGHPVVTSVQADAAQLVVPPEVAETDTAAETPTTPRAQAAGAPTDTAVPIVGGEPTQTLPRTGAVTAQGNGQAPRHVGPGETREQMKGELADGPVPEPSPVESATGDLIGGRPTTGGMGAAATPTSEMTPPQDTAGTERDAGSFAAPAQRSDAAARRGASVPPTNLADLSDDELSNPDAALSNPEPDTAEAVTRPYDAATAAGTAGTSGGSFPADQVGMADVFKKATNTAADDTWVNREPDALLETGSLPAGESGPRYDATDASAPAASEAWRPQEVGAESVSRLTATAAQPLRPSPQPALRDNAPSQAAAEAEADTGGPPAWVRPLAIGVGAAVLAGGATAGAIVAARRRDSTLAKARKAADATSQGIAATAATALAKAQELSEGVLKPAGRQMADQASETAKQVADTARQVKRQAKVSSTEAGAQMKKASAAAAQESAQEAQKQIKRGAKRAARRARWFRRGLIAGALAAVLFAPAPGEQLRAQLSSRIERLRSRMAS